jgi:hypothetical protein
MPTVLRWGPYRAFFYSNEGDEPVHLHVRSGNKEAKFWLHDVSLAVNAGFPAHEIGDYPSPETESRSATESLE